MRIEVIVRGSPKSGKSRLIRGFEETVALGIRTGALPEGLEVEFREECTRKVGGPKGAKS